MDGIVSVGALAASALSIAAEAALKGTVAEAVKESYKALRDLISRWAKSDIDALAEQPTSKARQAVVTEIVDAQSEADQAEVVDLARQIVSELRTHSEAIGVDIARLEALNVHLSG